jgi:hypothetical protein
LKKERGVEFEKKKQKLLDVSVNNIKRIVIVTKKRVETVERMKKR